ncbi:hypothetical protein RUM44_008658 [Polyplax serrata]|uniref:Uncharacterized protein n=1 Tax=Polyplax serrata TaxID=468196 RepID=A0ABR1BAT7_POLSC
MDSKTLRMVGSQMSISGRLSEKSNSDSTRKPRIRSAAVSKKQTLLRAKHAVRPKSAEAPGDSWSEASEVCERLGTLGYTSSSTELLQTLIDSSDLKTTHQVTFDDEIGNGLRREVAKSYENIGTQDEEFQFATCLASAQSGNECSKMEIYISNSSGLSEEEKTEINESDEPPKHSFFDVAERSLDKDDTIFYYSSKPCDKETDSEEDVIHSSRRETIVNAPVNNELQVTAMYTCNSVDRSEEKSKCEKLADEVRLSEREKYDSSISSKFDTVTEENLPQTSKEVCTQGMVAGVSEHSPLDLSKTSKIKERKDGTVCLSEDSTYEEIVQLLKTIDEEEDEDTSAYAIF